MPLAIQRQAQQAYQRFQENPHHPSLRFKQVHNTRPIYSARINRQYRALANEDEDTQVEKIKADYQDTRVAAAPFYPFKI